MSRPRLQSTPSPPKLQTYRTTNRPKPMRGDQTRTQHPKSTNPTRDQKHTSIRLLRRLNDTIQENTRRTKRHELFQILLRHTKHRRRNPPQNIPQDPQTTKQRQAHQHHYLQKHYLHRPRNRTIQLLPRQRQKQSRHYQWTQVTTPYQPMRGKLSTTKLSGVVGR